MLGRNFASSAKLRLIGEKKRIMPHKVDVHVGQRLKQRRRMLGLSQQKLAALVGIRFQQIQKYESGANRVSASRLYDISKALDVPVSFFFEEFEPGQKPKKGPAGLPTNVLEAREVLELVRRFHGLPEGQQKLVLDLVRSLSD